MTQVTLYQSEINFIQLIFIIIIAAVSLLNEAVFFTCYFRCACVESLISVIHEYEFAGLQNKNAVEGLFQFH